MSDLSRTNAALGQFRPYSRYKQSDLIWVGQIPSHWGSKKLKQVASVRPSNVDKKTEPDQEPVELCNYVDVYHNDVIDERLEFMEGTATADQIRKFSLRRGDVLITKDSESWDDIAVPAYVAESNGRLLCGYHLALIRPNHSELLGSFLFRAFTAIGLRDQFRVGANGITRFGLAKHRIDNALFPIPPLDEQIQIARFLERETRKMDVLVGEKERLIKLLQEKRSALITRAVTQGLDPTVPMKDSGVEWLGEIPTHWSVKRIKHLSRVRRGASPRPIEDPVYFDDHGEYSWVRISDVTASERYLRQTTQRLSELGKSKSVALEPGDLFLSIAASVGKPIITKIKCCIHDGFVYFPDLQGDQEFLYYVFSCGEAYKGLGKIGTQLNLNTDTIGDIAVPVPASTEERQAIVDSLDASTSELDRLIRRVQQAIRRVRELRAAVISAAVTGKIDVRGEVQ